MPSGALSRAPSPHSIDLVLPLVRPAPGGAAGLRPAELDVPAHDAPPAPDSPVGPETAGMVGPGVDDLKWAVRRRRLAQEISVEPQIAAPADNRPMRIPQAWKPPALTEVFHGEQGVGEEESSERRGSPGTGALLLAGESGLSHNSALILSK